MITATSTTHDTVSKNARNHQPSTVVAPSRAKFAKTSAFTSSRTTASTTNAIPVGIAFALLAAVLTIADADVFANFARLAACTLLGWWFLRFFESLSWVVLVSAILPFVDAYSVWRGPTKQIVEHHGNVFNVLSFAFPVPGEHAAANLGVPDLLFFALFLAAADRFGLRVYATWVCLVGFLGLTIAGTVWFDLSGLPALPGIALGFLVPNADLLWRRLRHEPGLGDRSDVPVGRPADDR